MEKQESQSTYSEHFLENALFNELSENKGGDGRTTLNDSDNSGDSDDENQEPRERVRSELDNLRLTLFDHQVKTVTMD